MSGGLRARLAEGGLVVFYCRGCRCHHGVQTDQAQPNPLTGARWLWNGSLDSPTFSPSILVRGTMPITDDEHARIMNGEHIDPKPLVCHSFVRNGRIEYLSDCTHEFAGQTLDLLDDEAVTT